MGKIRTTATKACMTFGTAKKGTGFSEANSELHNKRKIEVADVLDDETLAKFGIGDGLSIPKTEHWEECTVAEKRAEIEQRYKKHTNQKMQAKAKLFQEGVLLLQEHHTMSDVKRVCEAIEDRFGVHVFQIHIHNDEGRICEETGDFLQNRHAHLAFDWTDQATGISKRHNEKYLKDKKGGAFILEDGKKQRIVTKQGISRVDMITIQDIVAHELNMVRGEQSGKPGLNHVEYKVEQEQQKLANLDEEIEIAREAKDSMYYQRDEANLKLYAIQEKLKETEKIAERAEATIKEAEKYNNTIPIAKHIEDLAKDLEIPNVISNVLKADGNPYVLNDWERLMANVGAELELENVTCDAIDCSSPNRNVIQVVASKVWVLWDVVMKKFLRPTTKPSQTQETTNKFMRKGFRTVERKKGIRM